MYAFWLSFFSFLCFPWNLPSQNLTHTQKTPSQKQKLIWKANIITISLLHTSRAKKNQSLNNDIIDYSLIWKATIITLHSTSKNQSQEQQTLEEKKEKLEKANEKVIWYNTLEWRIDILIAPHDQNNTPNQR